jgi:hypothetical protein
MMLQKYLLLLITNDDIQITKIAEKASLPPCYYKTER